MSRAATALNAAIACLLAALLAWRLAGTPALLLVAATVPALGYAVLIARLDRFARQPVALQLVMLLWGAGAAALLATAANDAAQAWLGALDTPERARALTPRLVAPAIEELAKAAGLALPLLLRRGALDGVLDGIVYGALIGIGFALTENTSYFVLAAVQGGEMGLAQNVYLRALLAGLNHAAFTATAGAAVGWVVAQRGARRWVAPPLGLGLAIAEHVVWNALAADTINTLTCNPSAPGGACRVPAPAAALFVAAPLIVGVCIGPALAALAVAVRLALREQAGVIARQLRDEVRTHDLSGAQYAELCSAPARRAAERRVLRRDGVRAWRARRRFHRVATRLAFIRQRRGMAAAADDERVSRAEMLALARAQRSSRSTTAMV
jgi:RsiW-degrading membrane proteinase PrsW (M82 family)